MGRALNDDALSLLLVGIDLVGLTISAKRAGYRVLAADYFGDYDLQSICDSYRSVIKQCSVLSSGRIGDGYDASDFVQLAESMAEEEQIYGILLSSGLDDEIDVLRELDGIAPILGNSPEVISVVRNRAGFFKELDRLNVPHPHTEFVLDLDEAKGRAGDIGYPVVLKPTEGFAGSGVRLVDDAHSLEEEFTRLATWSRKGVLVQEHVEGVHASLSIISTSKDARVLSVNEQLLGLKELHQTEPFGYCGNIVPLDVSSSVQTCCEELSSRISREFHLTGSNGVDVVISEDGIPYVIEVNPRFQGTLECVEQTLGVNLVQLHLQACLKGALPRDIGEPEEYWSRLILHAPLEAAAPDLTVWNGVRDIPIPGSLVGEGEPLCSVFSRGESREASLGRAEEKATSIYASISRSGH